MALNLLTNRLRLYSHLSEGLDERPGTNHRHVHDSGLLTLACNLEHQAFVQNHTLVPYHRAVVAVTNGNLSSAHGLPLSYDPFPVKLLAKQGAWFCPECAATDRNARGLSYWRRFHQLPGISLCDIHDRIPLRHAEPVSGFGGQPHYLIDRSPPACRDYQAAPEEWYLVQRFTRIFRGLLESPYPMPREAAVGLIAGKGRNDQPALLCQLTRLASKPFLSAWLALNFPDLRLDTTDETRQEPFPLSSTAHFALALSLLFNTSECALCEWLNSKNTYFSTRKNKPVASGYFRSCINLAP